jgi:hypothetical protein
MRWRAAVATSFGSCSLLGRHDVRLQLEPQKSGVQLQRVTADEFEPPALLVSAFDRWETDIAALPAVRFSHREASGAVT